MEILPFAKEGEVEQSGQKVDGKGEISTEELPATVPEKKKFTKKILKKDFLGRVEEKEIEIDETEVISTTEFIYKEKEKLSDTHKKLKGREVMDLYARNLKFTPTEKVKKKQKGEKKQKDQNNFGVLINKRQF